MFKNVVGYDTDSYRNFLFDVQAHYPIAGELVEGGQPLMMKRAR